MVGPGLYWMCFQAQEREFRKTLDVKSITDKQTIGFNGSDVRHWIKLIILYRVYYRNGVYTAIHRDGKPLGIPLLKYTARILQKFPLCIHYHRDLIQRRSQNG